MRGDVIGRMVAAHRLQEIADRLPDRAVVHHARPLLSDLPQGAGEGWIANDIPGCRQSASGGKCVQRRLVERTQPVSDRIHEMAAGGEPISGEADRGLEQRTEIASSESFEGHVPAVDAAGCDDAERPPVGNPLVAGRPYELGGRLRARAPAGIQHDRVFCTGATDQEEKVTADAAHLGPDDAQHCAGCHARIQRVAAILQHAQSGGRGEVVRGSNGAVEAHRGRSRQCHRILLFGKARAPLYGRCFPPGHSRPRGVEPESRVSESQRWARPALRAPGVAPILAERPEEAEMRARLSGAHGAERPV